MGISVGKVFRSIEEEMRKHCEVESVYLPAANYKPWGICKNIRFVKKHLRGRNYDIIHITGTEHYLLPFLKKYKTILTVHDLGFFTNQNRFAPRSVWKYVLWINTLRYASKVTFISNKSLKEAEAIIGSDAKRYSVIYNPVSSCFHYEKKVPDIACPTVLCIGTNPNKNLGTCIVALKDLKCKLRIIGKLSSAQKAVLQLYHVDYSNSYNLTDQEIVEEYRKCDIVSFASLYEGFGMPIIEGQSIGRAVVTSSLPPMDEVAGNGAVLVNPYDAQSIKNGYMAALEGYERYVSLGIENVKRFQLKDIVLQYFDLYKKTI